MEDNQTEKRGHPALVTFILVLIILFLSGVLVYLRYGDLILNRVYQFTDGKLGVETGVTSLPGRDGAGGASVTNDNASGESGGASEESGDRSGESVGGEEAGAVPDADGGEIPDDGVEWTTVPQETAAVEPTPEPVALDYAAAKALPDGITLSTHDFTLRTLGESATVRVTGGSDGPFTWISENPSVAAVDENGKITAAAHGTVNVIVTDGVKKGLCVARMITGTTSTEAKLNASDFTRTVEEGEYQLKVSGVSAPITWTTEDPAVAAVDENGVVTPVGKGRTRIRAAWDGGYLICVVRVPG